MKHRKLKIVLLRRSVTPDPFSLIFISSRITPKRAKAQPTAISIFHPPRSRRMPRVLPKFHCLKLIANLMISLHNLFPNKLLPLFARALTS